MYVCICKGITDNQIKDAVCGGATTLRKVRTQLGAMSQCGKCAVLTKEIVEDTLAQQDYNDAESVFYAVN